MGARIDWRLAAVGEQRSCDGKKEIIEWIPVPSGQKDRGRLRLVTSR